MEQAVTVHFRYGSTDLSRLFALEDRLEDAIRISNAGEYDGHEIRIDGHDGILFMYGPDADRLLEVVLPVLKTADFMEGAEITRRYGPAQTGAREMTTTIRWPKP